MLHHGQVIIIVATIQTAIVYRTIMLRRQIGVTADSIAHVIARVRVGVHHLATVVSGSGGG